MWREENILDTVLGNVSGSFISGSTKVWRTITISIKHWSRAQSAGTTFIWIPSSGCGGGGVEPSIWAQVGKVGLWIWEQVVRIPSGIFLDKQFPKVIIQRNDQCWAFWQVSKLCTWRYYLALLSIRQGHLALCNNVDRSVGFRINIGVKDQKQVHNHSASWLLWGTASRGETLMCSGILSLMSSKFRRKRNHLWLSAWLMCRQLWLPWVPRLTSGCNSWCWQGAAPSYEAIESARYLGYYCWSSGGGSGESSGSSREW